MEKLDRDAGTPDVDGPDAGTRDPRARPAGRAASTTIVVFVLVAILLAGAAAALAVYVGGLDTAPEFDRSVAGEVLTWRNPGLDRVFWAFTLVGNSLVLSALAAGVVVASTLWGARAKSLLVAVAMTSGQGVSSLVKAGLERQRPSAATMLIDEPVSASFPSGHALMTVILFALVIFLVQRRLRRRSSPWTIAASVTASLIALGVGLSRVYLGVHWATDVLAGWCLGGAWVSLILAMFLIWERSNRPWLDARPAGTSKIRAVVAGLLVAAVVLAVVLSALADPLRG